MLQIMKRQNLINDNTGNQVSFIILYLETLILSLVIHVCVSGIVSSICALELLKTTNFNVT